jgi:hypothetical protein
VVPTPAKVLQSSLRRGVKHVLVQWVGASEDDATWEPLDEFIARFPSFQLEDELLVEGGRDVMWGITYGRRAPALTAPSPGPSQSG